MEFVKFRRLLSALILLYLLELDSITEHMFWSFSTILWQFVWSSYFLGVDEFVDHDYSQVLLD